MLYSSRLIPRHYFGVDAGPIEDAACAVVGNGKFSHTVFERTNFLDMTRHDIDLDHMPGDESDRLLPNTLSCFEVLEHVEPKMMVAMLRHMKSLSSDDARFFISTPCWNMRDCAANHVNEIRYDVLGSIFEREGFTIDHVYGTFASIRDYEHLLTGHPTPDTYTAVGDISKCFQILREYYDTNFLSCIFAPLFPAQSRNALWELKKQMNSDNLRFPPLLHIAGPWSSSKLWEELAC